jgi:epoxyqueuosine reductase
VRAEPDPAAAAGAIETAAHELGFARVGFAPVDRLWRGGRALRTWLARGYHGKMAYLDGNCDRGNPAELLPQAKTIVAVALAYRLDPLLALERRSPEASAARIAGYAVGDDYHSVMRNKLDALGVRCAAVLGRPVLARACVDTSPLLEREVAARAGIGFMGKSTLTIAPGLGSRVLLGELLLDVELPPSMPMQPRCGNCTACLDACPTQAFVGPYVLDARRCIAYLTIEFRGVIPLALRALLGDRVFGCDVCQSVCPFNASARSIPIATDLETRPALKALSLCELLDLSASGYRKLTRGSAMRRASRAQLARNAAVALGNSADPQALPALSRALKSNRYALVRGHVAWALGRLHRFDPALVRAALEQSRSSDASTFVRDESAMALDEMDATQPN